jgi:hypothetical protein
MNACWNIFACIRKVRLVAESTIYGGLKVSNMGWFKKWKSRKVGKVSQRWDDEIRV